MMKHLFALLLTLFLPCIAFAQTVVSGDQSGNWAFDNSPFLVTGHVTVPSGQTLTIEPGVEVNFQGHYKLNVNGNLQAIGTQEAMITFTTDTPSTGWGGLRVDTDETIALRYCRIEHGFATGDYPDMHGGGMALLSSTATVENCIFADNATDSDGMGGAVYAIGATGTTFTNTTFLRNSAYGEGGAIKFTGGSDIQIIDSEFIQNYCNYGGGAVSYYSTYGATMRGCAFVDNYTMYASGGAVHTLGIGNLVYFANCTMTNNNAVTGDGGAVSLSYAESYFVNTIAYQNPGMFSHDVHIGFASSAEIYYSNMPMPDGATGHHNINVDPEFIDVANFDLGLLETSQCIDNGIAYLEAGGETLVDLDSSQFSGSAPDIGAFEYWNMAPLIFADGFESKGTPKSPSRSALPGFQKHP